MYPDTLHIQETIMCNNCYEKFIERSGKIMLLCRIRSEAGTNELEQLCCFQHYCPGKDKYIPNNSQNTECKFYSQQKEE